MRKARVFVNRHFAGIVEELAQGKFCFTYQPNYQGAPISLTMPTQNNFYEFTQFPAFFEGLLPEGIQLEAMLRKNKIDKNDYFAQLLTVGSDLVGAVTVEEMT